MRTSSQIKDSIHDLRSDLDAMIALSERENRDFTSLEAAKADQILAQLETEKAALDTTTKLEAERNARSMQNPAMQEMLAANGHGSSSAQWTRDSRGRGYAILSKADKASNIFKPQAANEFGHYVVAKIFGASRSTPSSVRAALTTSDNSLGGFLVPGQLSSDVIDLARAKSVLSQAGMRTILMDSDSMTIPKLETDMTVATKAENASFTASDMVFGARQLHTRTAGCLRSNLVPEYIPRQKWARIGKLFRPDRSDTPPAVPTQCGGPSHPSETAPNAGFPNCACLSVRWQSV